MHESAVRTPACPTHTAPRMHPGHTEVAAGYSNGALVVVPTTLEARRRYLLRRNGQAATLNHNKSAIEIAGVRAGMPMQVRQTRAAAKKLESARMKQRRSPHSRTAQVIGDLFTSEVPNRNSGQNRNRKAIVASSFRNIALPMGKGAWWIMKTVSNSCHQNQLHRLE